MIAASRMAECVVGVTGVVKAFTFNDSTAYLISHTKVGSRLSL
jgi:hypothetical protein